MLEFKVGDVVMGIKNEEAFVARLKDIILQEFAQQDRKGLYAKTQKIMAYNSNKIEGSTLNSEQTATLFDTGTLYSAGDEVYRAKDIEEMNGHFRMFNHMLKTINEPLSEKLIKEYHYNLKVGVFEDILNGRPIGDYKNRANGVSDITTYLPKDVPAAMEALIAEYENSDKGIEAIARFHAKFEEIHPFQDGNGRTGRMIIFRQCIDSNIVPIIINDDTKMKYYHALHMAQVDNDYTALKLYFQDQQREYYEKIKDYVDITPMKTFLGFEGVESEMTEITLEPDSEISERC